MNERASLPADRAVVVLRAEHLTRRYGALTAVDDLTLDVMQGEIFGFLGPNGAGKTTSVNLMCGLAKPDAGRILIYGQPVHDGDPEIVAQVGVCPQEIILWDNLTCLEQLEFIGTLYNMSRRAARARGEVLLETVGLADKRHKRARTLSGGMQRRLNLIMALVHDPPILVLDEPEAGLDPQSRVLVREYILTLARQKTIILTTHNMDEAERLADRVAIIDHGRLLALDTPTALKRQAGEGDVLEIGLAVYSPETGPLLAALRCITPDVTLARDTVVLRAPGMIEQLPAVLDALRACGASAGEIRLRECSLEDVFISMTGRGLRE